MADEVVQVEVDAGSKSATIWLNRPDKRNALGTELVNALTGALDALATDDGVRAVFIRGRGAAFCAGADLAEIRAMKGASAEENRRSSDFLRDFFVRLYAFPKPTVAVVHGPALAGGCGLATCCDFVIASDAASFGYPEVRIGFIPALVMVLLTHQIGERAARDLCLSGRRIDAHEALRIGLCNRVVAQDALDAASVELAGELAKNSPVSMANVKAAFWTLHGVSTEAALEAASALNAASRATEDCQEGIAAFLEKRKPRWLG